MKLRGIGIDVHLEDGELRFQSTSVSGKILLSAKTRSMLLADVVGLSVKPATTLTNGNLNVQTALGRTQVIFRKKEGSAAQDLCDEILLMVPQVAGKAATGPLQAAAAKYGPRHAPESMETVPDSVHPGAEIQPTVSTRLLETDLDIVGVQEEGPLQEQEQVATRKATTERQRPETVDVLAEVVAARKAHSVKPSKERKGPKPIDVSADAVAARRKALDNRPINRLFPTPQPAEPWSGSMDGVTFGKGSIRYKGQVQPLRGARARVEVAGQISQHSDVGGMVVGGLLFGPIGAIVGSGDITNDNRELYLYVTGSEYEWVVKCKPKQTKAVREFASAINSAALRAGRVGL